MEAKEHRWVVPVVVSLAGLLLLGPALLPGYTLTYDMVFVPRQALLPVAMGLGDVLPRAVPQDAVLAVLTTLLPGEVWQHLALLFIVIGSGLGVARLLRTERVWQQCMGALLYSWSAYVAERLVLGSWPLLVSYAALPWVMSASLDVRRNRSAASARLLLLVALGSLAPSGGLLALVVAVPLVATAHTVRAMHRALLVLALLALQAPWVVSGLTSATRTTVDSGGAIFALTSEGSWGPVLTALGTGGVWNTDVVPATRSAGLGLVGTVLVLALAAAGFRRLTAIVGRSGALVLGTSACAGFLVAISQVITPGLASAAFSSSAPLALFRDGQRWLAPLALVLAVAAPLGALRIVRMIHDPVSRRVLAGALIALPLVVMPDAAWGVGGRLRAVQYPPEWQEVRAAVDASEVAGDVVVLPWSTFRQFEWNGRRTVLDPAPRWLTRSSVVDDSLAIGKPDGSIVVVSGESPRARAVQEAIRSGRPLEPVLREIGVGLALIEGAGLGVSSTSLSGLQPVLTSGDLSLMEVPGGAQTPRADPARLAVMLGAWGAALAALAGAVVALAVSGVARLSRKRGMSAARGGTVSPQSSGGTQS